jgi:large subunit ribosomal protein L10
MTKEEKTKIIEDLTLELSNTPHFYLADTSGLNAEKTQELRSMCFKNNIRLLVVKNTLLSKAIDKSGKNAGELKSVLNEPTSIMFTEVGNAPAKLIKEFRGNNERPILKGAYVEESVYIGNDSLESLVNLKSRDELIGDIIMLLQSPMNTVLSQLNSGKHILAGIAKTLSEKE